MNNDLTLEDLGYAAFFESGRNQLGLAGYSVARVIAEFKEAYAVKNVHGEYRAKVTGTHMRSAASREDYPAVGDWVAIEEGAVGQAVIRGILPRRTVIKRHYGDRSRMGKKSKVQLIAANVDVAFIVESVDRDYSLNRFERYFALAEGGGVRPVIVLNKIDLLSHDVFDAITEELKSRFPAIDMIIASTVNGDGLIAIKEYIRRGKTYCFLGSSGVGKSSIINALLGEGTIKTGGISSYSGRGKHVTTARNMYFLKGGGIVIDNPGIREVGVTDVDQGVTLAFDEITAYAAQCRYGDCTHTREAGCAVLRAVQAGELDEEKYTNYLSLKKEAAHYELTEEGKRRKDRAFGKFIQKAKKTLTDSGHKQ